MGFLVSKAQRPVIRLYGLRFKIELSFRQALRVLGVYVYRNAVRRKIGAYHLHIQTGLIAQGLLQSLAVTYPRLVWDSFGSWLRTVRPGIPPSDSNSH